MFRLGLRLRFMVRVRVRNRIWVRVKLRVWVWAWVRVWSWVRVWAWVRVWIYSFVVTKYIEVYIGIMRVCAIYNMLHRLGSTTSGIGINSRRS